MMRVRIRRLVAAAVTAFVFPASGFAAEAPRAPVQSDAPPIAWLGWSEEAFAEARRDGKGVLLTVVSRWCRPCAAADEEVWSDPLIRRLVATLWVPVRVDRDERPDLDARYQVAAGALARGKTGYPVTAFLFPTGEAVWADLFIPADDREGRPGMKSLLVRMDEFLRNRFTEARGNTTFVQKLFDDEKKASRPPLSHKDLFNVVVGATLARVDLENGGWGDPPRITNAFNARLVLLASVRRDDPGLRDQALKALKAAVRGGGMDPIGGGFHRAARDAAWAVPIFDKPLAANAAWLDALVEAVSATGDAELKSAASGTVDFLLGSMVSPEGGFWSALAPSADPLDDSAYYSWRTEDVVSLLRSEDLRWARVIFGFKDEGDLLLGLPPRFVPRSAARVEDSAKAAGRPVAELASARDRILKALSRSRAARPAPAPSGVRYLDSTSMTASALIRAGAVLDRPDATAAALKALDDVLAGGAPSAGGFPRRIGGGGKESSPALMADNAFFGQALLDAYAATGQDRYLETAKTIGRILRSVYMDPNGGGFYDVIDQMEAAGYVRLRRKPLADQMMPSPQAGAVDLLTRLAAISGESSWSEGIGAALDWLSSRAPEIDLRFATPAIIADALSHPRVLVTVAGQGAAADALARHAIRLYEPGRIVARAGGVQPSARVCVGDRCRDGLTDGAAFASTISDLRAGREPETGSVAAP